MRPIPLAAARQCGVFTTAQALAIGWTASALAHAVRVGYLLRVRHGVYAVRAEPGDPFADSLRLATQRAAAASLTNPGVPITGLSAAALFGMTILDPPGRVCAGFRRGHRGEMVGVHRHRGALPDEHLRRRGSLLATSPARTVVEVAREHGPRAGIVVADSALALGLADREGLTAAARYCRGWSGSVAAEVVTRLADPSAESVLESVSRLGIVTAGLAPPEPQVEILDLSGRLLGRCDFYWDEFGVVGEADGVAKYLDGRTTLRAEKLRQGYFEDAGLIVARWDWDDALAVDVLARRLSRAFDRGARPGRAPQRWVARRASDGYLFPPRVRDAPSVAPWPQIAGAGSQRMHAS